MHVSSRAFLPHCVRTRASPAEQYSCIHQHNMSSVLHMIQQHNIVGKSTCFGRIKILIVTGKHDLIPAVLVHFCVLQSRRQLFALTGTFIHCHDSNANARTNHMVEMPWDDRIHVEVGINAVFYCFEVAKWSWLAFCASSMECLAFFDSYKRKISDRVECTFAP